MATHRWRGILSRTSSKVLQTLNVSTLALPRLAMSMSLTTSEIWLDWIPKRDFFFRNHNIINMEINDWNSFMSCTCIQTLYKQRHIRLLVTHSFIKGLNSTSLCYPPNQYLQISLSISIFLNFLKSGSLSPLVEQSPSL